MDEVGWLSGLTAASSTHTPEVLLTWEWNYEIYAQRYGVLAADFSAAPLAGSTPLSVTFTNLSAPASEIDGYVWAFGDGTTSVVTHPTHVYTATGVYTVSLTATWLDESDTLTRAHYITVSSGGGYTTTTRTITYTYDPLNRLTGADYSTGKSFAYQYDAVGNRTALTSVTPLSGTLVTTYTFDAANRLTDRAVSDGLGVGFQRTYTYTWSARGQMLAEYTQGYPVRTFTYDGAGRMVEATVFTLTTRFTYNGLGARVAVEVVGYGTTTYTLDYAAGNRILAEETADGTTLYLYGRDCLGELRDDEWLYYLNDGTGLVRQGVDEQGQVVSGWLFDPDGTVLAGPQGPVSHLVCGGVYDWSTGLIYQDGRYFDPLLGIWLALIPLVVVQSWRGRKRKRGFPWYVVVLCVVGVSGVLTGCQNPPPEVIEATVCVTATPPFPFPPDPMPDPDDGSRDSEILGATVLVNFEKPGGSMHSPSWLGTIVEQLPDGRGRIITHNHYSDLVTDYYMFAPSAECVKHFETTLVRN